MVFCLDKGELESFYTVTNSLGHSGLPEMNVTTIRQSIAAYRHLSPSGDGRPRETRNWFIEPEVVLLVLARQAPTIGYVIDAPIPLFYREARAVQCNIRVTAAAAIFNGVALMALSK
jgi:hypothetical protein